MRTRYALIQLLRPRQSGGRSRAKALAHALGPITAIENALPPSPVVHEPLNGLAEAGFKRFGRAPAEFALDLRRVDRVTPIMPGPIGNECDQPFARPAGGG